MFKNKLLLYILALVCVLCPYADTKASESTVSIKVNDFGELWRCSGNGKLVVDKNITQINSYNWEDVDITAIEVSEDNKYYKSVDGVLYNKKMTELIYYPRSKESESFIIPDSVKKIAENAFYENKYLKDIKISSNITQIDSHAFYKCSQLKDVYIGKNVKSIEDDAFEGSGTLFDVDKDNAAYSSNEGVLFSKNGDVLLKYPAKKEGAYVIPDYVKEISENAFPYCTGLSELTLNESMDTFHMVYLNCCTSLKKLNIPKNLEILELPPIHYRDYYGGLNLISLEEVTVADGNQNFATYNGALYSKDYKNLYLIPAGADKLVIHKNVKKINDSVCKNKFTSVEIPSSNKNFVSYKGVLYNKDMTNIILFPSTLTTYEIPASLTDVYGIQNHFSDYPYSNYMYSSPSYEYPQVAENIKTFTVDKDNKKFASKDGVLYSKDMTILYIYPPQKEDKIFTVPESVTDIDYGAFLSAAKLEEITFTAGAKDIKIVFDGCSSLKKITCGEGIENISLFGSIDKLEPLDIKEVYLPGSLSAICVFNISQNTVFYGYANTGDYKISDNHNIFIKDVAQYLKENGYNFKSLGTAPDKLKNINVKRIKEKITVSWKADKNADGYTIFYEHYRSNNSGFYERYENLVFKEIPDRSKCSYVTTKTEIKGKLKFLIRPYKEINGVKVYGKKADLALRS